MTLTENARRDAAAGDDDQRVADLLDDLLTRFPPATTPQVEFLGAQFDLGLAWVHFAAGRRRPRRQPEVPDDGQRAHRRRRRARARYFVNPIGYGMCGADRRRLGHRRAEAPLPAPAVHRRGDLVPAVLRARRRVRLRRPRRPRRAGRRRVGRQRTEGLDHRSPTCRSGGCSSCAPTPRRSKHAGLTAFVVDMHAPGVEVRPLRQITGDAEFNEVYFTDVRIPDDRDARHARRRLAGVADHADERAGVDRRRDPAARARASSASCSTCGTASHRSDAARPTATR